MLVIDQLATAVVGCETWDLSGTMLGNSARQIIGHSNLEHPVMLIRDDVDPEVIAP